MHYCHSPLVHGLGNYFIIIVILLVWGKYDIPCCSRKIYGHGYSTNVLILTPILALLIVAAGNPLRYESNSFWYYGGLCVCTIRTVTPIRVNTFIGIVCWIFRWWDCWKPMPLLIYPFDPLLLILLFLPISAGTFIREEVWISAEGIIKDHLLFLLFEEFLIFSLSGWKETKENEVQKICMALELPVQKIR